MLGVSRGSRAGQAGVVHYTVGGFAKTERP